MRCSFYHGVHCFCSIYSATGLQESDYRKCSGSTFMVDVGLGDRISGCDDRFWGDKLVFYQEGSKRFYKQMNERTKTGLQILQVAMIIGVAGDIFLRVDPWGLGVTMFNVVFVVGMLTVLYRRAPEQLTWQTLGLFAAQLFFAAMFAWRDSIELRLADGVAILTILSVLFLPKLKVSTSTAGVFHYGAGFVGSAFNAIGAPFVLLFDDVKWGDIPRSGWRKHAFSAFRGVAIATPLILIFGGLFVAADAVYAGWVQRIFNVRPEIVFTHVLLFGVFSWLSAGYLRGVLISTSEAPESTFEATKASETAKTDESHFDRVKAESGEYPVTLPDDRNVVDHINVSDAPNATTDESKTEQKTSDGTREWSWADIDNSLVPQAFTLGTVEIGVVLGLMNLLFLSFVIVQVPYLFGGMELVQNTPDFKLAEYARRGFGELVTVAGLVLPILLASHWLIRKENPLAGKLFRVFAGIQIVLLFVVMASAVQRLVLLTGDLGYGMTTIRLYPLIFMTWLAIVFLWFGFTVLRGARQHFAWGALWAAFLILGATHVLNPDAFIVKTNISLMQQGREFDPSYNSLLSDDALPVLFEAIPEMNDRNREIIMYRLAHRYCTDREEGHDLRSWSLSRSTAFSMLEANRAFIDTLGGCDESNLYYYRSNHRDMD